MSTTANIRRSDAWFIGEDKDLVFEIPSPTGGAQDITGWTIVFTLSQTFGGDALPTFPISATLTDPPGGICSVPIPRESTDDLTSGKYFYTLWRTDDASQALLSHGSAVLRTSETVVP